MNSIRGLSSDSVQGEVDIVEGVNNQTPNLSSLHTNASAFAHIPILAIFLNEFNKTVLCHHPGA